MISHYGCLFFYCILPVAFNFTMNHSKKYKTNSRYVLTYNIFRGNITNVADGSATILIKC